ncbi:MAG: 4Fe-4S dicluster domain-containing protein [Acidobacteria bacterium]|nr:4Fe-4S dicluster domain-containing protein [Acidobacteriota bacterium]
MSKTTMSPARRKKLRKLAALMNTRHRSPLPVNRPLLECFDVAISDEEADLLLRLGAEPLSRSEAFERSGLPEERFRPLFEGILRKGLLWPQPGSGGEDRFQLAGIMLGWFEIYLSDGRETPEQKEFARRLDGFFRSFGKLNTFPMRNLFHYRMRRSKPQQSIVAAASPAAEAQPRKIAVDQSVPTAPMRIYPTKTVRELIERHGDAHTIALVHCFCRQYHKMVDEHCRFDLPAQSCIVIGDLTHYTVDAGVGRYLSKEEALELIGRLEEKGVVHQAFHEDEDADKPEIAVCNCCWDCCGVLGSYNRGLLPPNLRSYFEARLSDETPCSACAACVDFCPVQAISVADDRCRIDARRCIGCGQCELHCPEDAVSLVPNERTVMLPMVKRSEARIPC